MNYRYNKTTSKVSGVGVGVIAIVILVLVWQFVAPNSWRDGVADSLAPVYEALPGELAALRLGGSSAQDEAQNLETRLAVLESQRLQYEKLQAENRRLRNTLSFTTSRNERIGATVLAGSEHSPYDSAVINRGAEHDLELGELVYLQGVVPVAEVVDIRQSTALVRFFSASNVNTQVLVGERLYPTEATGQGGGVIAAVVPTELGIREGDVMYHDSQDRPVMALVESVSEQADGYHRVLARFPQAPSQVRELYLSP